MSRIFISYRRDDSAGYAGRLYDRLSAHFGQDQIFMDIDTIEPGADFVEVIEKAVGSCDVLIALIGRQWLNITDANGRRRLDNPADFVRLEIATALDRNIRVIPVLVRGATMPRSTDLPNALKKLPHRNALEISDTRFHYDVDRLIETLEKVLRVPETPPPAREVRRGEEAAPPPLRYRAFLTQVQESAKKVGYHDEEIAAIRLPAFDLLLHREPQSQFEQDMLIAVIDGDRHDRQETTHVGSLWRTALAEQFKTGFWQAKHVSGVIVIAVERNPSGWTAEMLHEEYRLGQGRLDEVLVDLDAREVKSYPKPWWKKPWAPPLPMKQILEPALSVVQ